MPRRRSAGARETPTHGRPNGRTRDPIRRGVSRRRAVPDVAGLEASGQATTLSSPRRIMRDCRVSLHRDGQCWFGFTAEHVKSPGSINPLDRRRLMKLGSLRGGLALVGGAGAQFPTRGAISRLRWELVVVAVRRSRHIGRRRYAGDARSRQNEQVRIARANSLTAGRGADRFSSAVGCRFQPLKYGNRDGVPTMRG
jgi:hypothetical protein